jgi:hypothetical protein
MADEQKGTAYVVLQYLAVDPDETSDDWRIIGRATAANDVAAIRAVTKDSESEALGAGPFVAVPARSWRPRKREVKSVQRELWT